MRAKTLRTSRGLIPLNLPYPLKNQPFATSHKAATAGIRGTETLAGNLLRDASHLSLRFPFYLRLLIDCA